MKFRLLVLTMLAFAGIAQAHTHLKSAVPADNSVVTSPPQRLELHFSEKTRLTAVTIQKEGEKEAKRIEDLPKESAADLGVPVAPLAPGKYVVNWRAVGADNHLMSGALHFTVAAK